MLSTSISVVIVNWNTSALLRKCLGKLFEQHPDFELDVIVVDNNSSDDSMEVVQASFPQVRRIELDWNSGFAHANNRGVREAKHEVVLLLNTDAWGAANFLQPLWKVLMSNAQIGLVAPRLLNTDGTFQGSHADFPSLWREWLNISGIGRKVYGDTYPSRGPDVERGPQQVDYVEGACMLLRRDAFLAVGGFDEGYWMYSEDTDLCLTLVRNNWQIWYVPEAQVIHMSAGSSRNRLPAQMMQMYASRIRYFRKNYSDRSATALVLIIMLLTAVKTVVFGLLTRLLGRQVGHKQPPLPHMYGELRGALQAKI